MATKDTCSVEGWHQQRTEEAAPARTAMEATAAAAMAGTDSGTTGTASTRPSVGPPAAHLPGVAQACGGADQPADGSCPGGSAPQAFTARIRVLSGMRRNGYLRLHDAFPADTGLAAALRPGCPPLPIQMHDDISGGELSVSVASTEVPMPACRTGAAGGPGSSASTRKRGPESGRGGGGGGAGAAVYRLHGLLDWMQRSGVREGSEVLLRFSPPSSFRLGLADQIAVTRAAAEQVAAGKDAAEGAGAAPATAAADQTGRAAATAEQAAPQQLAAAVQAPVLAAETEATLGVAAASALGGAGMKPAEADFATGIAVDAAASAALGPVQQGLDVALLERVAGDWAAAGWPSVERALAEWTERNPQAAGPKGAHRSPAGQGPVARDTAASTLPCGQAFASLGELLVAGPQHLAACTGARQSACARHAAASCASDDARVLSTVVGAGLLAAGPPPHPQRIPSVGSSAALLTCSPPPAAASGGNAGVIQFASSASPASTAPAAAVAPFVAEAAEATRSALRLPQAQQLHGVHHPGSAQDAPAPPPADTGAGAGSGVGIGRAPAKRRRESRLSPPAPLPQALRGSLTATGHQGTTLPTPATVPPPASRNSSPTCGALPLLRGPHPARTTSGRCTADHADRNRGQASAALSAPQHLPCDAGMQEDAGQAPHGPRSDRTFAARYLRDAHDSGQRGRGGNANTGPGAGAGVGVGDCLVISQWARDAMLSREVQAAARLGDAGIDLWAVDVTGCNGAGSDGGGVMHRGGSGGGGNTGDGRNGSGRTGGRRHRPALYLCPGAYVRVREGRTELRGVDALLASWGVQLDGRVRIWLGPNGRPVLAPDWWACSPTAKRRRANALPRPLQPQEESNEGRGDAQPLGETGQSTATLVGHETGGTMPAAASGHGSPDACNTATVRAHIAGMRPGASVLAPDTDAASAASTMGVAFPGSMPAARDAGASAPAVAAAAAYAPFQHQFPSGSAATRTAPKAVTSACPDSGSEGLQGRASLLPPGVAQAGAATRAGLPECGRNIASHTWEHRQCATGGDAKDTARPPPRRSACAYSLRERVRAPERSGGAADVVPESGSSSSGSDEQEQRARKCKPEGTKRGAQAGRKAECSFLVRYAVGSYLEVGATARDALLHRPTVAAAKLGDAAIQLWALDWEPCSNCDGAEVGGGAGRGAERAGGGDGPGRWPMRLCTDARIRVRKAHKTHLKGVGPLMRSWGVQYGDSVRLELWPDGRLVLLPASDPGMVCASGGSPPQQTQRQADAEAGREAVEALQDGEEADAVGSWPAEDSDSANVSKGGSEAQEEQDGPGLPQATPSMEVGPDLSDHMEAAPWVGGDWRVGDGTGDAAPPSPCPSLDLFLEHDGAPLLPWESDLAPDGLALDGAAYSDPLVPFASWPTAGGEAPAPTAAPPSGLQASDFAACEGPRAGGDAPAPALPPRGDGLSAEEPLQLRGCVDEELLGAGDGVEPLADAGASAGCGPAQHAASVLAATVHNRASEQAVPEEEALGLAAHSLGSLRAPLLTVSGRCRQGGDSHGSSLGLTWPSISDASDSEEAPTGMRLNRKRPRHEQEQERQPGGASGGACGAVAAGWQQPMKPENADCVVATSISDYHVNAYRWRKYGEKAVQADRAVVRGYYRCSHAGCPVTKHVDRRAGSLDGPVVTTFNAHNHPPPPPAARGGAKSACAPRQQEQQHRFCATAVFDAGTAGGSVAGSAEEAIGAGPGSLARASCLPDNIYAETGSNSRN